MIALEDGDLTAGLEQPFHQLQRGDRIGEVLEHKADERMIEGLCLERQRKQIGVQKLDV